MQCFSKKNTILFLILIILNVIASAYWLINGDIHYDVDVSRDFLVINDIVNNKHLTLLGPRSGAIPGVFHGPLWFYVNLPAFFIGGGNPLVVGWFWFILSIIFLWIIFKIAKKIFDQNTAVLAVLLLSVNSIINPSIGLKNFYNPYGAVFLFPIFFWLFYKYTIDYKVKYLVGSLFILGLIIQFQMAFGVPILIIATIHLSFLLIKRRKLLHLLSYLILLIPLSTFILFDIKNNGLQLNAIMQFFNNYKSFSGNILGIFEKRAIEFIIGYFDQLSPGKNLLTIIYSIFFVVGFIIALKKSQSFKKAAYRLFGYQFFGFWIISLFYPGGIGNYFWPFLPLTIIIFCSYINFLNRKVFLTLFVILYLVNLKTGIDAILGFQVDINKRGPHSWAFNLQVAKEIYKNAPTDFGYFTFSPDRFAYQQRYAMIFAGKSFSNIASFSSVKKPLTYLLEVDPPSDQSELNGTSWRISDIKIDRSPDESFRFDFIKVEKYFLDEDEIRIPPNPYLLDNVFMR